MICTFCLLTDSICIVKSSISTFSCCLSLSALQHLTGLAKAKKQRTTLNISHVFIFILTRIITQTLLHVVLTPCYQMCHALIQGATTPHIHARALRPTNSGLEFCHYFKTSNSYYINNKVSKE